MWHVYSYSGPWVLSGLVPDAELGYFMQRYGSAGRYAQIFKRRIR